MVEVMNIMEIFFRRSQAQTATLSAPTFSRPLLTHASTRDSWILMGKSGSVSCGVTAPFSWVLVHTRFCLYPSSVYFPVLCKFWQLYGVVNGSLLQEGCAITTSAAPRAPVPVAVHW